MGRSSAKCPRLKHLSRSTYHLFYGQIYMLSTHHLFYGHGMPMTYQHLTLELKAKHARCSVLVVLLCRGPHGCIRFATTFVIKRDKQAQRSILLTCCHIFGKRMKRNDVVYVRRMPQNRGRGVGQLRVDILYLNLHAPERIIAIANSNPVNLFTRSVYRSLTTLTRG